MLLTKPRYYLPASYVLKARAGVASTAVSGHIAETIQGASLKPLTRLLHAPYTLLTRLYSKCFVTRDEALSLLALLVRHYKYYLLYWYKSTNTDRCLGTHCGNYSRCRRR
jgi:hypothetical protein